MPSSDYRAMAASIMAWCSRGMRCPVGSAIAIVVDQFSLFVPPEEQRYFIIGRQLYGGNAVLYGYNEEGESIDLPLMPVVIFISVAGIEEAIAAGQIDRPQHALQ